MFCTGIESTTESVRQRKMLSTGITVQGLIKTHNGQWANNCNQSLEMLLNAHFPADTSELGAVLSETTRTAHIEDVGDIVKSARSYAQCNLSGYDGDRVVEFISQLFEACIRRSYVRAT